MQFELLFEERFFQDYDDAIAWYEIKSNGLGKELTYEIEASIVSISMNPTFAIRYNTIRCYVLKKFPYMIHYVLEENKIIILALISTYMNPKKKWIK